MENFLATSDPPYLSPVLSQLLLWGVAFEFTQVQTHRSWPWGLSVMAKHERLWAYALIATEHRTQPQGTRPDHITCHSCQAWWALLNVQTWHRDHSLPGWQHQILVPPPVQFLLITHWQVHVPTWGHSGSSYCDPLNKNKNCSGVKASFYIGVQIFCNKTTGIVSRFPCASYKNPYVQGSPKCIPTKNF